VGLFLVGGLVGAAPPAHASCVSTPRESPYRFTGTVTGVDNAGRRASVRTDDGRTVTVVGSDAAEPNAATSVDRAFQLGGRYEFHPLNDASPYRDNACTATHLIGGAGVHRDGRVWPRAGEGGHGPMVWRLGGAGVVVMMAAGGAWLVRRWLRRRRSVADTDG
jgi:hypothetical protein